MRTPGDLVDPGTRTGLLSGEIQAMRQQAEAGLASAVQDLNESLAQLAKIN